MVTDDEMKRKHDYDLANPPEEERKYWYVHANITMEFIIPRYGTKSEVEDIQYRKSDAFAKAMNPDNFTVEITSFEQEGE